MLPHKLILDLPDGTPKENLTRAVSFRIKPSDWDEFKRVAAIYQMEPGRLARRLLLHGLEGLKRTLRTNGRRK